MSAKFIEIDETELSRIQRDPSLAEALFEEHAEMPDVFMKLSEKMQERVRRVDPQTLARSLESLDPRLTARLGESGALTGETLLKLMDERRAKFLAARQSAGRKRPSISLDKAWHGVHYLLCGTTEPGATPVSQAVLGGTPLGEDDEGFSGYGPARYFTASQVAQIAREFERRGFASECASRFDAERMSKLEIYPGWRSEDKEWALTALQTLCDFYVKVASDGHAIIACIV